VDEGACEGIAPAELISRMLDKTATDRAVHRAALQRLDGDILRLSHSFAASGGIGAALRALRASSADVQRRREEQVGTRREKLCGVRLCGDPLRSCVDCEPNPVPGLEPCWPSWEDQFSPDERQVYCKRSMTFPGYDKAELDARTYPKVDPIPCWRTCWEVMSDSPLEPSGRRPTCLKRDTPPPTAGGQPGLSCAGRKVHCSPGCTPAFNGSLKSFWKQWETGEARNFSPLQIDCPCGNGG
jgi:hypothetical protein